MDILSNNIIESALINPGMILGGLLFAAGCSNLNDDSGEGRRTLLQEYTEHNAREWTSVSPEHLPVISFTVKQGAPYIKNTGTHKKSFRISLHRKDRDL